ncbi:MAG: cytochrome b [Azonexus sp.]
MKNANWPRLVRVQHWLTVLLMMLCVVAVWSHEAFDKSDPMRARLMQLHFLSGGLIGLLTVLRVATRAVVTGPAHAMPPLVAWLAKAGHLGLYLLLILLPLCGYVAVSGKGLPINLLGWLEIPPLPVSSGVAKAFKVVHEGLGNALIALVAVHVAAALWHALLLKDKVLPSMLGRAAE